MSHSMLPVAVKLLNCLCAGWRRAVLAESWPGACGHSRRLVGLPPPEQRGSGWAAESSPACHHPGALWTGTRSTTYWWGTHTHTQTDTSTTEMHMHTCSQKLISIFCNWLISQTRIVCTWKNRHTQPTGYMNSHRSKHLQGSSDFTRSLDFIIWSVRAPPSGYI